MRIIPLTKSFSYKANDYDSVSMNIILLVLFYLYNHVKKLRVFTLFGLTFQL